MFGKLMKYELHYLVRYFAPMWVIVLSLCALGRVVTPTQIEDIEGMMIAGTSWIPAVLMGLSVAGIMTMMVVSTVVLLQRFYKGKYGDEGYLMFTLPVTSGGLLHSKAFSAVLMMLATILITIVGVIILVSYEEVWSELTWAVDEAFRMLNFSSLNTAMLIFWIVVMAILAAAQGIYLVYLAITIGQLWRNHPVIGAVGAYYGINLLLTGIEGGITYLIGDSVPNMLTSVERWLEMGQTTVFIAVILYYIVHALLVIGGASLIMKFILDKKLNIA